MTTEYMFTIKSESKEGRYANARAVLSSSQSCLSIEELFWNQCRQSGLIGDVIRSGCNVVQSTVSGNASAP